MRVLYDGVAFQNSHQRGVQRVFREVVRALPAGVEGLLTLTGPARGELPRGVRVVHAGLLWPGVLPRKIRGPVQAALARAALGRAASSCDVFNSTYYTLPPRDMPAVVHVHDMIVERHADLFPGRWAEEEIEQKRRAIEGSSQIITVSNATASELEHFYPGVRAKVTTIHLAGGHVPLVPHGARDAAAMPHALYIGDRGAYKNFGVVLDAMESRAWPACVGLKTVGAPWKEGESLRVERLGATRRIVHAGRLADGALADAYRSAACVVVPSTVEGFGLPLLEAQVAGAPLVCSDTAVFREVAGEGAIYFDPHRPEELAERVSDVLNAGVRDRLLEQGARNAGRFSWERCAAETVAVYRRAIGS